MKRAAWLALAVLLVGCGGTAARKKQLMADAELALSRQDAAGAAATLEQVRELDPKDAAVLVRLGQAYLAAGNDDKAFLPLQEAAEQPGGAGALLPLGHLLRKRKQYAEAEPVLKKAIALGPDKGQALVELGVSYWLVDKVEPARETLEQAVAELPDSFIAQFHLGEVYRKKEDWARAREHLSAALKADPESPYAAFALAETLFASGEAQQAMELYRKVVLAGKPFPRIGRVYFQLAQLAYRKHEGRPALGFLDLAAKNGYDADTVALYEARIAMAIKDEKRAAAALDRLAPREASYPQVVLLRGRLELMRGHVDAAVAAFEAATKLPLDAGEVQAALGTALLAKLDAMPQATEAAVDATVAAYTRALRARPRSHEALAGMARVHTMYRVDLELAATELKSALEAERGDNEARALLASVLACQRQLEPALELLEALPKEPKDPRRQWLHAALLLALDRAHDAEEEVVRGLKEDSRDLDGRLVLCAIYSRTGRLDACREMLAKLLDPDSDSEVVEDLELIFTAIASTLGPARPPDPFRKPTARLERRLQQVAAELPTVEPAKALELERSLVGEFCVMELKRQLPPADRERLRTEIGVLVARRPWAR